MYAFIHCTGYCGLSNHLIASVDHSPHAHPASPSHELPADFTSSSSKSSSTSFSSYRQQAQQHGPLGKSSSSGTIGGHSGHSLGPVAPSNGEFFDRNELPARFRRTPIDLAEIDAIETGGATLVCWAGEWFPIWRSKESRILERKTLVYCYVAMRPDHLDTKGDEDYWDTSAGHGRTWKRHEDHRTRNPQLGKVIMAPRGFLSLMNGPPRISNHWYILGSLLRSNKTTQCIQDKQPSAFPTWRSCQLQWEVPSLNRHSSVTCQTEWFYLEH